MATEKISAMTAAGSIDPANDYIPIIHSGSNLRINRNTYLGISSQPLGLTDTQSPTNKTFDVTSSYTTKDGNFTLQNSSDTTKQMVFSLSGITTGNTRTLTVPDASGTLVTTAATQTLTAKTLTAPTISGGTIDNATITVDSISGHTVSTTVTVANLQISSGVLNSANAVTSTSIAAGAVQPQALVSGTGTGWALSSFTPTWTNLTVGNATQQNGYIQSGKIVLARLSLKFGSTTTMGTSPTFTLPVTSSSSYSVGQCIGVVRMSAAGSGYLGYVQWASSTTATVVTWGATGNYVNDATITASVPGVWALNDSIFGEFFYEAA